MTMTAQTIINAENRPVSCVRKAIDAFIRSSLDPAFFAGVINDEVLTHQNW